MIPFPDASTLAVVDIFGQTLEAHDLAVIGLLIVLEGVLSIDNALVLGILAKRLPKRQQGRALTYGLVGAFVFRLIAIALAAYLLAQRRRSRALSPTHFGTATGTGRNPFIWLGTDHVFRFGSQRMEAFSGVLVGLRQLLAEKDPASFDRVFGTKVEGACSPTFQCGTTTVDDDSGCAGIDNPRSSQRFELLGRVL